MLRLITDWLIYGLLGLPRGSKLTEVIHFFFYDSLKIFVLLFCMIAIIGFLRTYLPQEKVKQWILEKKGWGNFFASLFGAITPFCSCSSIPFFLSFIKANIPLGICFSFLIASPLINEYLVVLMFGFFGWKITFAYIVSGMAIGIFCGYFLGKMNLEKHLVEDMLPDPNGAIQVVAWETLKQRIQFGLNEAACILKKLWAWILIGVAIGAFIHNCIPEKLIQSIIERAGILSVPIATLLGVPLYGSCAAIIPVAVALFEKGMPLGTALSFMMAIAALSLPEAIMLRRAMRLPLIGIFFGITSLGIIFTGYLFNFLQKILI